MASEDLIDAFPHPWFKAVRGSELGLVDDRSRWVADLGLAYAGYGTGLLAGVIPGSRLKKKAVWRTQLAAVVYAYFLPDLVARYATPSVLLAPARQRVERVLSTVVPAARELVAIDPANRAAAGFTAARLVSEVCSAAGLGKIGGPLQATPTLVAAMAGTERFVEQAFSIGTLPPPPAAVAEASGLAGTAQVGHELAEESDEDDAEFPEGVPLFQLLTGDALGFDGHDRLRVDLCLGFGIALQAFLRDEAHVALDGNGFDVVAIAGFLAAAPVVADQWGIDMLTDERSEWQVRAVVRRAGFPYDTLARLLRAGDAHGWLAKLTTSTRDALARLGIHLPEDVLMEMPSRLSAAGAFVEQGAKRLGV